MLDSVEIESRNLLIVAIRGSASKIDHMVNINNQATGIGDFIVSIPPHASCWYFHY